MLCIQSFSLDLSFNIIIFVCFYNLYDFSRNENYYLEKVLV